MEVIKEENEENLKIVIFGDKPLGNSPLINSLVKKELKKNTNKRSDIENYLTEITIEGKNYQLEIIDTNPKEFVVNYSNQDFDQINRAEGYILTYSMNDKNILKRIKIRYEDIKILNHDTFADKAPNFIKKYGIIVVGYKSDIEIDEDINKEVKQFCTENNIKYIQIDAKSGENIQEVFESISKQILQNRLSKQEEEEEWEEEEEESKKEFSVNNSSKGERKNGVSESKKDEKIQLNKIEKEINKKEKSGQILKEEIKKEELKEEIKIRGETNEETKVKEETEEDNSEISEMKKEKKKEAKKICDCF
jgi:small GTP-binding protein